MNMSTSAMPIDTQQMVHERTAAGIRQAHAGAIVSVVAGAMQRHHALIVETVCSKCDLDHAVSGLNARIDEVNAKIDAVAARLDAKIDAVDAKIDVSISKLKAELIMWIVSAGLFQSGLIVAMMINIAD